MQRVLLVCLLVAAATMAPVARATVIDWQDGQWDHGSGDQLGYDNGQATGTTNSGAVTVNWAEFGTATGNHSLLGGAQPTVRTDFNGSATDGALSIGTASDNNAGTLVNYVTLTVSFTDAVNLLNMLLGDVDDGGAGWEDFIAVEGWLGGSGGTLRTTTYSINPGPTNRHTAATMFGNPGVRGTNGNVDFDSDEGNVGVTFDGPVDFIRVYFHQGSGTSGTAQHGVWLRDIEYESVPEPGTLALVGLGFVALSLQLRKLH